MTTQKMTPERMAEIKRAVLLRKVEDAVKRKNFEEMANQELEVLLAALLRTQDNP